MTSLSEEEAGIGRGAGTAGKRIPTPVAVAMMSLVALWSVAGSAQTAHGTEHSSAGHELYSGAVLFDKLEYGFGLDEPNLARWEGLAFYGTDYDRVLFRTQGETTNSARSIESAEFQLLYSRLVGYYWDV
jgi:copper resistance protein B